MKIIIDAMGGDNAPEAIVAGTLEAVRELDIKAVLVGPGETVLESLKEIGQAEIPPGIEILHAPDVISMSDDPSSAVKTKLNSSIVKAVKLLHEGGGDAVVSAGNTGALLSAGTLYVKRIKGIRRAALAPFLPAKTGKPLLIDCGANIECTPEYLLQFAYMGSIYAGNQRGLESPRVGLLNIGTEETKGGELQKEAYKLLNRAGEDGFINFIGNIEGRGAAFGEADVIVCDGYSGNILLKTMEGVGMFFASLLKDMFTQNALSKFSALLVKKSLRQFKKILDYSETGGSPLLGLNKPIIKAHGASNAKAVKNAVRQAVIFAESGTIDEIKKNIGNMRVGADG